MDISRRHALLAGIAVLVLLAGVVVLWSNRSPGTDRPDALAGWPAQVSLTCTACSRSFEIPAPEYVAGMDALKPGSELPFTCPGCGGHDVCRTENLQRLRDRLRTTDE